MNRFSSLWSRFLAAFGLELRLIVRHWSYWLVNILYGLAFLWSEANWMRQYSVSENLLGGMANNVTMITAFVAFFLAGFSAVRTRRNRFELLEAALPTNVEVILGRWLATATACLSFLILPLVLSLIHAATESILLAAPVFVFIFECMLVILFTTGLLWLIEALIGLRRWMFPLLTFLWFASITLPIMLSVNGLTLPGIDLLNFGRAGYGSYSELWGRLHMGDRPLFVNTFYTGLVILICGVIVQQITRQRLYRRALGALILSFGAGTVTLGAGTAYTADIARANAHIMQEYTVVNNTFRAVEKFEDPIFPADLPYVVTDYDLTLDVATMRMNARLEVVNRGNLPLNALDFTLYRQFDIVAANFPFERDVDSVRLTLLEALQPGTAVQVTLTYQGSLWKFIPSYRGSRTEPTGGFLRSNGVYLPFNAAWYPMARRFSLNDATAFFALPDKPIPFRILVKNGGDLKFASNLVRVGDVFQSEGATWVELIGAPNLAEQHFGSVTVYAGGDSLDSLMPLVATVYAPTLKQVQRFFPDVPNTAHLTIRFGDQLTSTSNGLALWSGVPASAESLNAIIGTYRANHLSQNSLEEDRHVIYAMLWQVFGEFGAEGRVNLPLVNNTGMFLWAHHKANGDSTRIRAIIADEVDTGQTKLYRAAAVLTDMYETAGEAAVRAVFRQMRLEYMTLRTLPAAGLAAWIEENIASMEAAEQ